MAPFTAGKPVEVPSQLSLAVVGADHPNKRGPTRRFEIRICKPGEPVELILEPRNPVDPRAVAVYSCRGIQIGYVRAERASYIGAAMRRGIVTAIFQQEERWGATIRAGLDGVAPALLEAIAERQSQGSNDDFWPDYIPPEE